MPTKTLPRGTRRQASDAALLPEYERIGREVLAALRRANDAETERLVERVEELSRELVDARRRVQGR